MYVKYGCTDNQPIIGIGQLSAVLPIIGFGRLLCRYCTTVIYYVLWWHGYWNYIFFKFERTIQISVLYLYICKLVKHAGI